ncbi:nucleotidyl transferase AbiEii/AbiGii toxin family protein [Marinobacter sp. M3C]|jgi:predicted nucleotidyltransferase component of viral defense system|uniref:nucleotidyl transferase AbiEii/AbiGii toxin family protein n=1 Tax=unclassified Marinobacter TaxID=83889 RepID=UPI00200CDA25|nr:MULTISPECIES: nucleotidyl transferase AbiEii/AbiGii toxin family protein [unclassified Marinobacter]MCL1479927.1 nucleotidyl transferase AbiEii/AbiGii toxin family protein [Marinobacter sp.]UQG57358.1 nucleotidyl transferase AbiEii/AbiGii toxin family protein [Marinobacter sp. M4C]UQG61473.1 nucleotidyl transferase AbiEii/AbiGii toxin family protein [Marinobacter sp. M3C]UQG66162.1 nucleotidyl transferase AbiEii/AbiGii toxin family protein [Marinobacter sp. M2C]UQG70442.1 nucleotidyl transf
MDKRSQYYSQVQLLLQLIPHIAKYPCFALKGGTAINLFIRDFPRLSVDIDLVFLPMIEREAALDTIRKSLSELAQSIRSDLHDARVVESFRDKQDALRLTVSKGNSLVKVELSPVLRGTVYEPMVMSVCDGVEEEFGFAEMQVVHFSDLYAGKICAALDRQHPRDLFDVKWLLDNEGINDSLRKALLVYMISHNRPIAELLHPRSKDISDLYESEFRSMTQDDVPLKELVATRERLVDIVNSSLTESERRFLITFKQRSPDWSLLGLEGVERLPAVRWKLHNLSKMSAANHTQALQTLKRILKA